MNDLNHVWSQVVDNLYKKMTNVHFNSWIKPLIPLRLDGDTLYINANINLIKNIIVDKYLDTIEHELEKVTGKKLSIVVVEPKDEMYSLILLGQELNEGGQVSFLKDEDKKKDPVETTSKSKTKDEMIYNSSLNPKYTFDNFVKGKSNEFALAVATNVADDPGGKYNPLFIFGGSGLGKTHLMQAIGHKALEEKPESKVLYVTSENFVNEFISTITDSKNSVTNSQKFRSKYRNADILMIDDIQFIAGKDGTQEEIFHTFNSLREAKKQIILTSDKLPKEIKNLEERLVTRFAGGMMADIQNPDFETRVAIIKHKMKADKIGSVPNIVLEFIANNIKTNIRELEAAIIKVMAFYNLRYKNDSDISDQEYLEIAKEALSIEEKEEKVISLDSIKEEVASYYGITKNDLISKSRQQNIARPRQIAMYLSRTLTDLSLIKIANSFDRDHSTIMHGYDKIESMMDEDIGFAKEIKGLIAKIKG